MNIEELKEQWLKDPRIFQIADKLSFAQPQQIQLSGLAGSSTAFLVNAIFAHPTTATLNHLIILEDAEEAAYFHNSMEYISGALDLFYFPSSYKNKKNYHLLNPSHVMLRTEALTRIAGGGNKKIIVTYPEALFEKVLLSRQLRENIILIKQAEEIKPDSLLELLVMLGFTRTDFVYEPGQFALRGGILDIYSFGNEKPYRIELFGNEVESIRIFDPETQLSERKLLQVSIIPNIETQFESGDKVSLFEFLPENLAVWTTDWQFIKEKIEQEEEYLQIFIDYVKENGKPVYGHNLDGEPDETLQTKDTGWDDVIKADELALHIANRHQLTFGKTFATVPEIPIDKFQIPNAESQIPIEKFQIPNAETKIPIDKFQIPNAESQTPIEKFQIPNLPIGRQVPKADLQISKFKFQIVQQPSFNRNFNLLISDLKEWEKLGFKIYLFAEQARQLERLYSIFTDLNTEIQFTGVPLPIHRGFIDKDLKTVCYTDHQIFQRYHKYKVKQAFSKNKAITLKTIRELQPGDYVTHIDHGVGIFSGLQKIEVNGRQQEAVRLRYKDNDLLYVNLSSLHKISKYTGKEGTVPKMNKLGSDVWNRVKEKTKKQIVDIAEDLIKLYAERKAQKGFAHSPDNYMQTELEASFIYEDTPDQGRATAEVKADMEKDSPMDRLVCGDVGFGKTEIAIRAAFKSVCDSKQAAVLVPTTILAYQHWKTFSERLKEFPVTVDFINRFKSAKDKKETLQKLEEGKVDIIIGTHALLGKGVKFKDLGIMIIDEEQKFGVTAKEKLKQFRATVDSLTLTATPIPRTLNFSLMGARDLSVINTPPPNRQPVQTEIQVFNEDIIRDAIYYETERGGQVFFIHNRVASLPEMAALIHGLCPDLSIAFAHGQMEGDKLEDTILDFMDRRYDVLVCTNIVESGVDIPNVNTIIVNNAHQFGLSDLHQLRGRVGRSNKKAFCYLLAPPMSTLPTDSRKRLQTLEQFSDLGSGFQIAMRDLDIRGAGNLLGSEQSGFIAEIGFEMYQKILDEAIRDLKRRKFKDLFKKEIEEQDDYVSDCSIDTDLEILIPDTYVDNIAERLSLYTRLDNSEDEEELQAFHTEMQDRFGPIPPQVEDLFRTVRARKMAVELGFEKMLLKDGLLKCHFVANHESPYFQSNTFNRILEYVTTRTNKAQLKQIGVHGILFVRDIKGMEELVAFLGEMHGFVAVAKIL